MLLHCCDVWWGFLWAYVGIKLPWPSSAFDQTAAPSWHHWQLHLAGEGDAALTPGGLHGLVMSYICCGDFWCMVSTYMCLAVIAEYEIIFVPNTAIAIGAECGYYLYLCTCVVHEIVTIKLYYHHNCKEKDMARSGSKTETLFDDVPEQPKVLRLTLRSKKSTTWQGTDSRPQWQL